MSSDLVKSFKVATALASQRIVCNLTATAHAVKYPAGVQEAAIGVTIGNVIDATGAIPVQLNGIAKVLFNDTCVSGSLVGADSAGRGIPYVLDTEASSYIGILLDAKVNVTGTVAQVLIQPGNRTIP